MIKLGHFKFYEIVDLNHSLIDIVEYYEIDYMYFDHRFYNLVFDYNFDCFLCKADYNNCLVVIVILNNQVFVLVAMLGIVLLAFVFGIDHNIVKTYSYIVAESIITVHQNIFDYENMELFYSQQQFELIVLFL
jgi:hypothetical protein